MNMSFDSKMYTLTKVYLIANNGHLIKKRKGKIQSIYYLDDK